MSFIKKMLGGGKKAELKKDMRHFDLVLRCLEKLKQRGLISDNDFSDEMIIYNGENTPRIIAAIDRIFHEGYFSGIEASVERFCYLIGMGIGLDKLKTPKSRIKLINTETNKSFDQEAGCFRYSRFDYYADESDELWELVEGFHTVPVDENVTYEYANSEVDPKSRTIFS